MAEIERNLNETPDALRRLARSRYSCREDAERLFERLRLSNAEHRRLTQMSAGWWRIERDMQAEAVRALVYRLGAAGFVDRTLLAWSRSQDATDDRFMAGACAISAGLDIRPDFRWPQPISSRLASRRARHWARLLRKAEEAWIAADFPSDKGESRRSR